MATSGSVSTNSYDGRYYKVSWTAEQSTATNKSTITWTLEALGGNSSWYADRTLKVVIGGEVVYSKTNRVERYKGTIKTGTVEISHNSDGTKSFSISIQAAVYDTPVNCTGSKSFALDTIARKSSLSASNGTLGSKLTLSVSKQASDFTHTITYKCGSASGTVCSKVKDTTVYWNTDNGNTVDLASQNTTGTSVTVTFTITTYSGSTSIGSNTKTVTMSIPESVKPSCIVDVTDTKGYKAVYGRAIKGLSKLKITVTPTLAKNSPIATYKVTANGATYTTAVSTTDVLKTSGDLSITAKVTDKRGRTGSKTVIESVYNYSPPTVSKLSVKRCNQDGTENGQGNHVKATFSYSITSLSNQNLINTAKLYYKKTSLTDYEEIDLRQEDESFLEPTVTNGEVDFMADTESSYDVKLVIGDNFQTVSRATSASTAQVILDFGADGNGIGVGKVCEVAGLDVGFETRFRDKVQFDKPAEARASLKTWCFDNTTNTSYAGIARPDGTTTGWTRVTQTGLLPYEQGGNSSSLGSSGWPFKNGYFKNLYVDGNDIFNGSGWQTATLTSDFVKYDGKDDNIPQYKKIGKLVEVRGAVSPKTAITGSADAYTIFTLPEGYRPSKQVSVLSPGSGANQWLLTITAAGLVRFARYNNGAGYVNATTTTWLPFHAMYFVD